MWKKSNKIRIACPECGSRLRGATQEMIGDIGVCGKCKCEFRIGVPQESKGEGTIPDTLAIEQFEAFFKRCRSMHIPDALTFFKLCRGERERLLRQKGIYSDEQVFWIDFAMSAVGIWKPDSNLEIKLSDVLGLYKDDYCRLFKKSDTEECNEVFVMLKERYEVLKQMMYQADDLDDVPRQLGAFMDKLCGKSGRGSFIPSVMVVVDIAESLSVMMPLTLIEDV